MHGTRADDIGVTDQICLQRTFSLRNLKFLGDEEKPRGHHSAAGGKFTLSVQKIKMSARWVFMILVCCRLSHASQPQGDRGCFENLRTVCVSAGVNVSVPCPKFKAEEEMVTYKLLQNEKLIYNGTCNHGAQNCDAPYFENVELHHNTDDKSVSFLLTQVNASDHGLYRCKRKVSFPPPFITEGSDLILVLVKGHQCNIIPETPSAQREQNFGLQWILILILVIVSVYSIIVTVIAIFTWLKLRKTDSQSDYMNTKPKPARDRKKNRGIQNPFPRHF
ncbi:uncharacterized protein [Pagrus major]|uniref:uncharacterized protein n=1 Tax=Pagrus major TaxID=143350 RepID=UPI003CC8BDCC